MKVVGLILLLVVSVGLFDLFRTDTKSQPQISHGQADPVRLKAHVNALVATAESRYYLHAKGIEEAAKYIEKTFNENGVEASRQPFKAGGKVYNNIQATIGPKDAPLIVIGAHYDVAGDNPGADDNASGVAGVLELARILKPIEHQLKNQINLVAYCLEEPPFFGSSEMGSAVHAKALSEQKAKVNLMMSLEIIGYFTDEPNSQDFPLPMLKAIYPTTGNFIAVAGDMGSLMITKKVKSLMAEHSNIGVEFINAPRSLPGIDLSDHRSYWEAGYPAVMITDTAFYRNMNYHTSRDTPDTLDYVRMAEVVNGAAGVAIHFGD